MLVGAPDTPYTAVMLQVHYLLPRGVTAADLRRAQYRDSSGVTWGCRSYGGDSGDASARLSGGVKEI